MDKPSAEARRFPEADDAAISDELERTTSTSQTESQKAPDSTHGGHRRSLSGSILARLPFLRASHEELPSPDSSPKDDEEPTTHKKPSVKDGSTYKSSMAAVLSKTRRRKGSLRKTAIMGTREQRGNALEQLAHAQSTRGGGYFTLEPASADSSAESTPSRDDFNHSWSMQQEQQLATLDSLDGSPPKPPAQPPAAHPSGSPAMVATSGAYTSTTDDDEGLSLAITRPSGAAARASYLQPAASSLLRRRSTVKPSPLTRDVSPAVSPPEWDYNETEWWGWAILVLTWIVFVVGMGSCLGVWSWAWDVGETPRAPPELEDDPTLPIVGYYPALMVLTAVMAWLWVIVAWVGIKTFRHAKVVGDD